MYCIIVYNMYCTQQEDKILMINNNFNSNTAVVIIRNHIDSKCYAQTPPGPRVAQQSGRSCGGKSKLPQPSQCLHSMGINGEDQRRSMIYSVYIYIYGIYVYTVYKLYIYYTLIFPVNQEDTQPGSSPCGLGDALAILFKGVRKRQV